MTRSMDMDRRRFIAHGAALGLAAWPVASFTADLADTPGSAVPLPPPIPLLAQRFGPLLDRARDALDRHHLEIALRDRIALVDFRPASSQHRFHIVDLVDGSVTSYLVAHGKGSDPAHSGYLQYFSNVPDSQATSEGAYRTGPIYDGRHGPSMRLAGLDATNSNADVRAIVVHAAPYATEDHLAAYGKLGRSDGCFVVAPHLISQVLALLGPGRMLYAAKL